MDTTKWTLEQDRATPLHVRDHGYSHGAWLVMVVDFVQCSETNEQQTDRILGIARH